MHQDMDNSILTQSPLLASVPHVWKILPKNDVYQ